MALLGLRDEASGLLLTIAQPSVEDERFLLRKVQNPVKKCASKFDKRTNN